LLLSLVFALGGLIYYNLNFFLMLPQMECVIDGVFQHCSIQQACSAHHYRYLVNSHSISNIISKFDLACDPHLSYRLSMVGFT